MAGHWPFVENYFDMGLLPIPNKAGDKRVWLAHCSDCNQRIANEKKTSGTAKYTKCNKCNKMCDIITKDIATSHWTEYRRVNPHNVGLLCHKAGGIMVLDIDIQDDGMSFFKWWTYVNFPEWNTEASNMPTWITRTPKAGYHFYFKYDENFLHMAGNKVIISPSTGNAVGIDLKMGNCQVLAPPSFIQGNGEYKWLPGHSPGDIPEPMAWAGSGFDQIMEYHKNNQCDATSATTNLLPTPTTVNNDDAIPNADDDGGELPLETRTLVLKLLTLLSKKRVDNYDSWRDVGFALGRISYTNEMYTIYKKWSQTSSKYDKVGVTQHWQSGCNPTRSHGYALAALKQWAMEDNPVIYNQQFPCTIPLLDDAIKVYYGDLGQLKTRYECRITETDVPNVIREIQDFFRKCTGVLAGRGVIIKLEDEFGWHYEYPSISEFRSNLQGDKIYFKKQDEEESISFLDVWTRMKANQLTYSYLEFRPFSAKNRPPMKPKVLNLFTGFAVEAAARLQVDAELEQGINEYDAERYRENWEPWFKQTQEVICNNHDESFQYLLDLLAKMFQEPGLQRVCPLLQGIQGTGKTQWMKLLVAMHGRKYCDIVEREQDVKSEFTGNRQMVLLRWYEDNKGQVLAKYCGEIKNEIDSDLISDRQLYKAKQMIKNRGTTFITINDSCAFDFAEFKRRLLALEQNPIYSTEFPGHADNNVEHNTFMAEYYQKLETQVAVYRLLLNRDISSFRSTIVPETPLMRNWRKHNPSPIANFAIKLGQQYRSLLKGEKNGDRVNQKGPTSMQLHDAYIDMNKCKPRTTLWEQNKLSHELNRFLEDTGIKGTTAKPGKENARQLEETGHGKPKGNLDGFYSLSLDDLETALHQNYDLNFKFERHGNNKRELGEPEDSDNKRRRTSTSSAETT